MKTSIVVLLASFLIGCTGPAFESNFNGIDLACCIVVDTFTPAQPMEEGKSNLPGQTSNLADAVGAVHMETKPRNGASSSSDTTSEGIYRTQLALGPKKTFLVSATFQNPARDLSTDPWTVVLITRPGVAADDPLAPRLQLSLRTMQDATAATPVASAELRVQEGPDAAGASKLKSAEDPTVNASAPIVGQAFQDIFISRKPFTLSLFINREDGVGFAGLVTESATIPPITFKMNLFAQTAAVPITITTVGAALVNTGPGLLASVDVTHFEILTECEGFDLWDVIAGRRCD
jgi:hypothetical protein